MRYDCYWQHKCPSFLIAVCRVDTQNTNILIDLSIDWLVYLRGGLLYCFVWVVRRCQSSTAVWRLFSGMPPGEVMFEGKFTFFSLTCLVSPILPYISEYYPHCFWNKFPFQLRCDFIYLSFHFYFIVFSFLFSLYKLHSPPVKYLSHLHCSGINFRSSGGVNTSHVWRKDHFFPPNAPVCGTEIYSRNSGGNIHLYKVKLVKLNKLIKKK